MPINVMAVMLGTDCLNTRTQLSGWTGSTNSHNLGADIVYLIPATSTNNMPQKRKYLSKFPWFIDKYKT